MEYEKKVPKSFSVFPSQIDWLEKRAKLETKKTGRKVSTSDVLTRIITIVQENETANQVEKVK